ncbi:MAG: nucleotidyltransferase family protein [Planctomycetes bacterium]|nr:nucleotidyltransferase family protein [Planctomycetota bacterium]
MDTEVRTSEAMRRPDRARRSQSAGKRDSADYARRAPLASSRRHVATETAPHAPVDHSQFDTNRQDQPRLLPALRNIRMMHLLERIAARFHEAGVPLMVLKGAALNLAIYDEPSDRPMDDIDLLVRPRDHDRAAVLLEQLGCLRGGHLVRDDFFPRFHYESDHTAGTIDPVKIDLHVRPLRPLRYSRLNPDEALWRDADCCSNNCDMMMNECKP